MSSNLSLVLDSRVEEDIDRAAQWYANQKWELAIEFLEVVDTVFNLVIGV
ncbi:hypothetical protein [Scytonema sp. NUACC26]